MKGKRVKKTSRKQIFGVALALVLVLCAAGGTIAWLATSTNSVVNTFTPATFNNDIHEDPDPLKDGVKENVKVQNTGEVDSYIRAAVIVNWVDSAGNTVAEVPVLGTDYSCSYNLAVGGWQMGADGYYYYTQKVTAKDETDSLITKCEPLGVNANGYQLRVTILSEGIQAVGLDAKGNQPIELAWGVDIVEGKIVEATIK